MFFLTFIRFESKKFFPFRNKTFNLICKIDQLFAISNCQTNDQDDSTIDLEIYGFNNNKKKPFQSSMQRPSSHS